MLQKVSLMGIALIFLGTASIAVPPKSHQEDIKPATHVYKTVGKVDLHLFVYKLPTESSTEHRPCFVFFHGGGWRGGSPKQFEPHCRYYASRGMVAITVEYRLIKKHGTTPLQSIADARSAVRWVRGHATELGIDPERIVAGGGSAGGHLAACTALVDAFDEESEDRSIHAEPNTLVLFNPALNVDRFKKDRDFGKDPKKASPHHNIRPGVPPTLIFHGTADKTVPFQEAVDFCEEMKRQGNPCELVPYEGRGHGFFNKGRGDGKDYTDTLQKIDRFLNETIGFPTSHASQK